jgi:hypothetical protein
MNLTSVHKLSLFFEAARLSRSIIVCQNLTGQNAVVFSNATHVASMNKILTKEMGICVSCVGIFFNVFNQVFHVALSYIWKYAYTP